MGQRRTERKPFRKFVTDLLVQMGLGAAAGAVSIFIVRLVSVWAPHLPSPGFFFAVSGIFSALLIFAIVNIILFWGARREEQQTARFIGILTVVLCVFGFLSVSGEEIEKSGVVAELTRIALQPTLTPWPSLTATAVPTPTQAFVSTPTATRTPSPTPTPTPEPPNPCDPRPYRAIEVIQLTNEIVEKQQDTLYGVFFQSDVVPVTHQFNGDEYVCIASSPDGRVYADGRGYLKVDDLLLLEVSHTDSAVPTNTWRRDFHDPRIPGIAPYRPENISHKFARGGNSLRLTLTDVWPNKRGSSVIYVIIWEPMSTQTPKQP